MGDFESAFAAAPVQLDEAVGALAERLDEQPELRGQGLVPGRFTLQLVISDAHEGLKQAISTVLSGLSSDRKMQRVNEVLWAMSEDLRELSEDEREDHQPGPPTAAAYGQV